MQLTQDSRGNYSYGFDPCSGKPSRIGIRVGAMMPVQGPGCKRSMEGWSSWIFSADPSKSAISPESGSSCLFRPTLRDQMWIVSGSFGMAITFESKGDFSIGNDLSWLLSCATTDNGIRAAALIRTTKKEARQVVGNLRVIRG